jgi:hypothetical protein
MTTTTLSPVDLASAFIANLKADAALVAAVTAAEIRSVRWQGDSFSYPNIRLDDRDMRVMEDNGNCHGQWFNIGVSIYVFTHDSPPLSCNTIMGIIGKRYQNGILDSTELRSQPLDIMYINPVAEEFNTWRGEVIVTGRIKEKV